MPRAASKPRVDQHRRLGIPRRFHLHGHVVTVRIIPAAEWQFNDSVGMYDPTRHQIYLRDDQGDTELQQTFCHEWAHALLCEMHHRLSHSETFVDNLGSLLQQSLSTFDSNPKG